jgi:hypothetical protein
VRRRHGSPGAPGGLRLAACAPVRRAARMRAAPEHPAACVATCDTLRRRPPLCPPLQVALWAQCGGLSSHAGANANDGSKCCPSGTTCNY